MITWAEAKHRCTMTMSEARKRCNDIKAEALREAVSQSGSRQEAAKRLGMHYRTFYSACRDHGVDMSSLKDKRGRPRKSQELNRQP